MSAPPFSLPRVGYRSHPTDVSGSQYEGDVIEGTRRRLDRPSMGHYRNGGLLP